jgi:phage host-nuclease inhibitor protein Gam
VRQLLAITDLTRMQRGAVCIAGQDREGHCIRPVLPPPGIPERALKAEGKAVIFPFAVVEFEWVRPTPKPPHCEDHLFAPASVRFVRTLTEVQKRKVLNQSKFDAVVAIFEQPIQRGPGFYVLDGEGPRSVGTIQPKAIHQVFYEQGEDNAWNYRLGFFDQQDEYYRLKITDLTWNYYCAFQRTQDRAPAQIASDLTQLLKSKTVHLRIGLSRGWAKFPGRCFLQVNGVYTFPDYLRGKIFTDFTSST